MNKKKVGLIAVVLLVLLSFSWYILAQLTSRIHMETPDGDSYCNPLWYNMETCGFPKDNPNAAENPPYSHFVVFPFEKAYLEQDTDWKMVCKKGFFEDMFATEKNCSTSPISFTENKGVAVGDPFYIIYDKTTYRCKGKKEYFNSAALFEEACTKELFASSIVEGQFRVYLWDVKYLCPTDDQHWLDTFCEVVK